MPIDSLKWNQNPEHDPDEMFSNRSLEDLIGQGLPGYNASRGIHIYSELRPIDELNVAADDATASAYLKVVELYVRAAMASAKIRYGRPLEAQYSLRLFELQHTVLHFYLEGEESLDSVLAALQFAFSFTKVVYEALTTEMGANWNGFAVAMDHGRAILMRHGNDCSASVVSLGAAANRPAKRLLSGRTPAGTVEIPARWANLIGMAAPRGEWITLNLRDRERLPLYRELGLEPVDASLKNRVNEAISAVRNGAHGDLMEVRASHQDVERGRFTVGSPYRTKAFAFRPDLDGFSMVVEEAQKRGPKAEHDLACRFAQLLEFGDYYERTTPGAIRLPWAGDCATFVMEPQVDLAQARGVGWVDWVERWQSFAVATDKGREAQWNRLFPNVQWSMGLAHGDTGQCLLAVIEADDRRFLIAAGWPLATSLAGQNLGRGGDVVIPNADYAALYPAAKALFSKPPTDFGFWRAQHISLERVQQAAEAAGARETGATVTLAEKAATVQLPRVKPHFR